MVGKIGAIGVPVDDEQFKFALLRSLPHAYESLAVTLENMVDYLSMEDVHARIVREEVRRKKRGDDVMKPSSGDQKLLLSRNIIFHHCKKKMEQEDAILGA